MRNTNEILAHWYEQLTKIYKFAHRKNLLINLRSLIKDMERNAIVETSWNESHVDIARLDLINHQLAVGFVKIDAEYVPLFPDDIVYVDKRKYAITESNMFDDTICRARECDTNAITYLAFEDMLLNPTVEYVEIDGITIIKPRRIDASQIVVNYNNINTRIYMYDRAWYEFDSVDDKKHAISYIEKIFK